MVLNVTMNVLYFIKNYIINVRCLKLMKINFFLHSMNVKAKSLRVLILF